MIKKLIKLSLALELNIKASDVKDVKKLSENKFEIVTRDKKIHVRYIGNKIYRHYDISW